jgi:putative ABC transport system permease protein
MKLQDFRVAARLLKQDFGFSLVALLGLGVGLAVALLLLGFARYSYSYDSHVPDADDVYVIKQRNLIDAYTAWSNESPVFLREAAKSVPGVVKSSGYLNWFPLNATVGGQTQKLASLTALPDFVEMMGVRVVAGDLTEALSRPDTFAITESAAKRLFGTTNVLGTAVLLTSVETQSTARIAAILKDPPANTTIPFESLNGVNLGLVPDFMRHEALTGEQAWPGNLLVRLAPGASVAAVTDGLQQVVDIAAKRLKLPAEVRAKIGQRRVMDVKLSPLRAAYFDNELAETRFTTKAERGSARVVAGLVAIALLILGLAAINYVNLATIRVIRRQREISMRKVLGAGKGRLALQFVAESLLVSLLATLIGLALAALALPVFGQLMNRDLAGMLTLNNLVTALVMGIVLGLITAIYPAWIAFGVRPAQVLAGRPDSESAAARRLRKTLSVVQIAAAMGLASFALAIYLQTRFAIDASPGFDPQPLLVFEINEGRKLESTPESRALVAELSRHAAIAGVAFSTDAIGRSKNPWNTDIRREGGTSVDMSVKSISANFFQQYGISPVAGRLFDPKLDPENGSESLVINELAAHSLGFTSAQQAVGTALLFRNGESIVTKRVIGIAPEIRFASLREPARAVAYEVWRDGATLTVRASGSTADAERAVRNVWPKYFPNSVLEMTPAKDIYAASYADDARLAKLLGLATVIAMLIAGFGAYVIATDSVQRRTREIALRKLFGARRDDIGKLVASEIGAIILLAAVGALPLAALAIARYLAPYTEHTPIAYWTLIFALISVLAVIALAAARQAWMAMRLKPAIALRC